MSLIYHDPSMCETKCNKYNNCQKMAVTNGALLELNRDPRLKASRVRGCLAKVFKTLSVCFEEYTGSLIADGNGHALDFTLDHMLCVSVYARQIMTTFSPRCVQLTPTDRCSQNTATSHFQFLKCIEASQVSFFLLSSRYTITCIILIPVL